MWESWLSTDRSTAFFAHTLFCPIPSNLNSILKSWMRVVVFIRSCFHRCHRNVCAHELWVILTAPDACTILPHLSVSNIYIVVIELANCNLRRQLRFGFSFFFFCSLEWEKMCENWRWWRSQPLTYKRAKCKTVSYQPFERVVGGMATKPF